MIPVTNSLRLACNSDSLVYKEYIVIDGTTVEIKGKMSNTCYSNGNFIGTFNMKSLTFTTQNDIEYKKKVFEYYKSVNGESFKIGSYIVTDVVINDSDETVSITAMDYALKFAQPYITELDYASGTVTLFDVLQEVCTKVGVTLKNISITNGDFIVDSNQFVQNEQYGNVIANIAGISGNFATITEDDKLELLFNTITESIDNTILATEDNYELITEDGDYLTIDEYELINDYIKLDDKRDTQPITCVALGLSNVDGEDVILKDENLIAEYGENWLIINDNYFAYTDEKRLQLIQAIFDKVKGFGYSAFVSEYAFKPYLQLGDLIKFRNKDGQTVKSIVLKIDTDYDNVKLSAQSVTKATINYDAIPDAITIAKNAQIAIDKANAQIELKVNADDVISAINLSPEEIAIQSNKIKLEGYTTINDGFSVDLDGNATMSNATINGGNLEMISTENSPTVTIKDDEFYSRSQYFAEGINFKRHFDDSFDSIKYLTNLDLNSLTIEDRENNNNVSIGNGIASSTEHNHIFQNIYFEGTKLFEISNDYTYAKDFKYGTISAISLESKKKNFEKFDKGLDLINNSDIYEYNFKNEIDEDKKHIGLVIPDEKGNFKTPNEVISKDGKGIDTYSMIAVAWQAIKEQQFIIEQLKKEIKQLKRSDK